MLKASFETKCFNFSIAILSQSKPLSGHLLTASYFFVILLNSFTVLNPQGHFVGKINFFISLSLLSLSTETTWGITSPALSIITVSPTLISFLRISSSLCKVAFETTTPPILTGLIFATGVKAPVLPTWISIFSILDTDLFAENLWAIAHLGAFATLPNLFCRLRSLIL